MCVGESAKQYIAANKCVIRKNYEKKEFQSKSTREKVSFFLTQMAFSPLKVLENIRVNEQELSNNLFFVLTFWEWFTRIRQLVLIVIMVLRVAEQISPLKWRNISASWPCRSGWCGEEVREIFLGPLSQSNSPSGKDWLSWILEFSGWGILKS